MFRIGTLVLTFALSFLSPAKAQQGDGTDVPISTYVFKPNLVQATPDRVATLKVPAGFTVQPFATGLKNARVIAVSEEGYIYVSRRDQGDVVLLKDVNGDGKADEPARIVATQPDAHGLAIKGKQLFLVTVKEIYVADIASDGSLGPLKRIIKDLPDAGQHANRTIAVGPDGMLYISIGSCASTFPC
jgi:glucose/arabinose dehydrogenase